MELALPDGVSPTAAIVTSISLIVGLAIIYKSIYQPYFTEIGQFYRTQPWVGIRREVFSRLRADIRTISDMAPILQEGYEKYSSQGKAFLVPLFASEPFMVVPPSKIKEFTGYTTDKIDPEIMHQEVLKSDYTLGKDIVGHNAYQMDVVRRQLTRKLPIFADDLAQELSLAFESNWGRSESWTSVKVFPSCIRIVSRAANRVFGGKELCRNEEFLEASKLYAQGVFGGGALIRLFPTWMHWVVGPIVRSRLCKPHLETVVKHCTPIIEHRVKNTKAKMDDPSFEWDTPNDALQWLIEDTFAKNRPELLDTRLLCRRFLVLNMVAIHTTSLGITNTLLDMFSSPRAAEIVASLRAEVEAALAATGGRWSKDIVNSLHRHDSAIRESMRCSVMGHFGLQRMVVAKEGVDFGDGLRIPAGVRLTMPQFHIHHDDSVYPDAHTFDPFRFSAPREHYEAALAAAQAEGRGETDMKKVLELKNQALITTGGGFLAFGNGIHSCPGRFFASNEMKIMLAHVVLEYDVKPWPKRPENMSLTTASVPRDDVEITIRKRQ